MVGRSDRRREETGGCLPPMGDKRRALGEWTVADWAHEWFFTWKREENDAILNENQEKHLSIEQTGIKKRK